MVIDYIKSSVDIILNLKFEEIEKRLIEKTDDDNINKQNNNVKKSILNAHSSKLSDDYNKDLNDD